MSKKISIVLPTYNGELFLAKSIDSVLNQTYKNIELIIVDDCSTDSTPEILNSYLKKDPRIKVIRNEKNKKLPASLNVGFSNASGDYYTWTSDDNEYYPEALEKMINFLENNSEYGMVYAICDLNQKATCGTSVWGEMPATPENLLNFSTCGACFLYRKEVAQNIGKYDETKFLAEDHDYWLRIRLKYKIANITEHLYLYRLHQKSLTKKYQHKARLIGINLAIHYAPMYLQTFPETKNYISTILEKDKILINKIENPNEKLLKFFSKKEIYKFEKKFYILDPDIYYLKNITKLGFIYIFKALKLYIKYNLNNLITWSYKQ